MAPRAAVAILLLATLPPVGAPVAAAEWSVSGFVSQRLEAGTNFDLESDADDEVTLGSITDLGLTFRALTKTSRWSFSPGFQARAFNNEGSDSNGVLPRFNGAVIHERPLDTFDANLSVIPETSNQADFDEGRGGESNALSLRLRATAGWTRRVTPRDELRFGVSARAVEFVDSGATDDASQAFGGDARWTRRATAATDVRLIGSVERFLSDADGDDADTFSLRAGVDHDVNARLRLSATAGATYVVDESGQGAVDSVGDVAIDWLGARDSLSLFAAQDVDQNIDGEVENRISAGATYSRRLTRIAVGSLRAQAAFANPVFDAAGADGQDDVTLSISPTLSLDISRDWTARLGYTFRSTTDDDGAVSNLVFIEISRGLSLLP